MVLLFSYVCIVLFVYWGMDLEFYNAQRNMEYVRSSFTYTPNINNREICGHTRATAKRVINRK